VINFAFMTWDASAIVHSDNRLTAALAIGIFAAAVGVSLMLIAVQQRPFSGRFAVQPKVLVEVMPRR
jgi:hypothetical protein